MIKAYITLALISAVMIGALVYAFSSVGSPAQVRGRRFDNTRVSNIRTMTTEVELYYSLHYKLPATLSEAIGNNTYYLGQMNDPETKKPFDYMADSDSTYKICATFADVSAKNNTQSYSYPSDKKFDHEKGYQCLAFSVVKSTYSTPTPYIQPSPFISQ